METEIEALDHLIEVLDGGDSFFHTFKLSNQDISRVFTSSQLSKVDGFRLLGALYDLVRFVNHDKKFNKLLSASSGQEQFLYDNTHTIEPSLILETYVRNIVDTLRKYPDVFKIIPQHSVVVREDFDTVVEYEVIPVKKSHNNFTKKLSRRLKRTSTKSIMSLQSSIVSNETVQTSIQSVPSAKEALAMAGAAEYEGTDASGLDFNVASIIKNVIFQFSKMFQNIEQFNAKYRESTQSCTQDLRILKQTVNESIVVATYNMLTEYSLKLLDEEISDMTNSIVKV